MDVPAEVARLVATVRAGVQAGTTASQGGDTGPAGAVSSGQARPQDPPPDRCLFALHLERAWDGSELNTGVFIKLIFSLCHFCTCRKL